MDKEEEREPKPGDLLWVDPEEFSGESNSEPLFLPFLRATPHRRGGDTSYPKILHEFQFETLVVFLGEVRSEHGEFYKVLFGDLVGYVFPGQTEPLKKSDHEFLSAIR